VFNVLVSLKTMLGGGLGLVFCANLLLSRNLRLTQSTVLELQNEYTALLFM
jgi:hypothetical protein